MVDEFIGTGKTIKNRINDLEKRIQQVRKDKGAQFTERIVVCTLAAMDHAILELRREGIEVHAALEMPAGVSGRFRTCEAKRRCQIMQSIEGYLDQSRMKPFPSLGYGQAEALFYARNGNPPNSNFPIFWWKHLQDGSAFQPILDRDEPKYVY